MVANCDNYGHRPGDQRPAGDNQADRQGTNAWFNTRFIFSSVFLFHNVTHATTISDEGINWQTVDTSSPAIPATRQPTSEVIIILGGRGLGGEQFAEFREVIQ
jgi:hypothetical protein